MPKYIGFGVLGLIVLAIGLSFWLSGGSPEQAAVAPETTEDSVEGVEKSEDPGLQMKPAVSKPQRASMLLCKSYEYPGSGPDVPATSDEEWSEIERQFNESRARLLDWLKVNASTWPAEKRDQFVAAMSHTKLQREVTDPDLAWRGMGAAYQTENGALIQLGGGFPTLFRKNPERARFELTRLVAQAWSPCQIKDSWTESLRCLGYRKKKRECERGTYSLGGWVVSTALAAVVSPPGCRVQGLVGKDPNGCLAR